MWRNDQCDEMGDHEPAWWILMRTEKLPIRVLEKKIREITDYYY